MIDRNININIFSAAGSLPPFSSTIFFRHFPGNIKTRISLLILIIQWKINQNEKIFTWVCHVKKMTGRHYFFVCRMSSLMHSMVWGLFFLILTRLQNLLTLWNKEVWNLDLLLRFLFFLIILRLSINNFWALTVVTKIYMPIINCIYIY